MKRSGLLASLSSIALSIGLFLALGLGTAYAQDPLKVAPNMYKLLYENERVRVMEVRFKPGEKIAKHSHPDHFGYVLSGGMLKISTAEAEGTPAEFKVGQVVWIPAQTHWAENTGTTDVVILISELKEPAKKAAKAAGAPATQKK